MELSSGEIQQTAKRVLNNQKKIIRTVASVKEMSLVENYLQNLMYFLL
jgi:nucleoside-triphosphatase THEP1